MGREESRQTMLKCQVCQAEFLGEATFVEVRLPGVSAPVGSAFRKADRPCPECGAPMVAPKDQ
jgi:rubrerythrin